MSFKVIKNKNRVIWGDMAFYALATMSNFN